MTFRAVPLARLLAALLLALGGFSFAAWALEPKDAEPTDPDYKLQGEYAGSVKLPDGEQPIGVQVIALGKGKFKAVAYVGGLPGDGWDQSPKRSADGELKDGAVVFAGDKHLGSLKDGLLTISVGGVKIAELKKVDRTSPTLGAKPPEGAVVLFDGTSPDKFEGGRMTEDGLLLQGVTSKPSSAAARCTSSSRRRSCPRLGIRARQ